MSVMILTKPMYTSAPDAIGFTHVLCLDHPRHVESLILPESRGGLRLRRLRSLPLNVQRVQRLAGGHEQPIALGAAEAEVGAGLRQVDLADQFTLGHEDVHAVKAGATPASAGPHVAVRIAADAVGRARAGVNEDTADGIRCDTD